MKDWHDEMYTFLQLCNQHGVRMLLVGGGAVNYHGYQRYSDDLDFWLDTTPKNLKKLISIFKEMDYKIDDFPEKVKQEMQNISVKLGPSELNLELTTNFSVGKSFDEAFEESEMAGGNSEPELNWRVLSYGHLIASKIKSGRPKDLTDVQELQKRNISS